MKFMEQLLLPHPFRGTGEQFMCVPQEMGPLLVDVVSAVGTL